MENVRIIKVTFRVKLAGPITLKGKRSRIAPILAKVRGTYQCAAIEAGTGNHAEQFDLVCVVIAATADEARSRADTLVEYLERSFRSEEVFGTNIEWLA